MVHVDRATPDDVISLATDVGPVPMQVGAVLFLEHAPPPDQLLARLTERLPFVPRLRQRLLFAPPGAGRPVWIDHPAFDIRQHVSFVEAAAPGDEEAALRKAVDAITARLPRDRPLWRIAVVSGLRGGRCALVPVFHHVLADGIGGLAVLASLVDGASGTADPEFPRPRPRLRDLFRDVARDRVRALRELPGSLRRVGTALRQLRPRGGPMRAAVCSLNRPTGPHRHLSIVRVGLEQVHRVGREHGATVNDVVLTAVAGALHRLLQARDERVEQFVVSVPVSARRETTAASLGNEVGVVPVSLVAAGPPLARLRQISAATRAAKAMPRAASTAVLGPVFRILARVGVFTWFINRQRLVHTFVTNLRGPETHFSFLGVPIVYVAAVGMISGNVTCSFAVISYGGTLSITMITDPEAFPDHERLRGLLAAELDRLCEPR